MNTIQVFLVLLWVALTVLALIGGCIVTVEYARDADHQDLPVAKALGGTVLRGGITLLLVAVIIGLPLDLMKF